MSNTRREELKAKIKDLEAILDSGASSVTQDGVTTNFDLKSTRQRLRVLRDELALIQDRRNRRPILGQIDLSGG